MNRSETRRALALARVVFQKELVDTLRDRRTLATMLLIPMVVYPLFVLVASEAYSSSREAEEKKRSVIGVLSARLPPPLERELLGSAELGLGRQSELLASSSSTAIAGEWIRTGEVDAVLVTTGTLAGLGTLGLDVLFDPTKGRSQLAADRLDLLGRTLGEELTRSRMISLGHPPSAAKPIAMRTVSIATSADVGRSVVASFLPMLILFFVALSTFYPAVDVTAGEKERGTLATLLTAPVGAFELVLGKYAAVVTIGTLTGLLNVGVIALTLLRAIAGDRTAGSIELPPLAVPLLLAGAVLLALVIGAVMVFVAALARGFRDASNLLAPVMLVLISPAMLAQLPTVELTPGTAILPVANVVLALKSELLGHPARGLWAPVIATTLLAAVVTIRLAARAYEDERVLFSTEGRRSDLWALLFSPPSLGAGTGLALAAVFFIVNYFGSFAYGSIPIVAAVALTQTAGHVLPSVGLAAWVRGTIAPRALLGLSLPARPGASFGGAALLGATAWVGVSLPILWAENALFPGQRAAGEALARELGIAELSLGLRWLGFAAIPALAEELAFRGALLGVLSARMSPRLAIGLQAIVFGLAHGSLYRLLPTLALGLFLGLLRHRTGSIWPGVLAHALNNGILLSLDQGPPGLEDTLGSPNPIALAGAVGLAVGLAVLPRSRLLAERPND